jgi:hypothetical protein
MHERVAVAYLLQFHDTAVVPYLLGLELSREGRIVLAAALHRELRVYADTYINNPERRLAPNSDCFQVNLVFRDPVRRVLHELRLIISDAAAQYGVLRVLYAEDETRPQILE